MDDCDLLKSKLNAALTGAQIEVINNSHLHAGHAGSPNNGRSHFKVSIKSDDLNAMMRVRAHQRVYEILDAEMKSHIHALEIELIK